MITNQYLDYTLSFQKSQSNEFRKENVSFDYENHIVDVKGNRSGHLRSESVFPISSSTLYLVIYSNPDAVTRIGLFLTCDIYANRFTIRTEIVEDMTINTTIFNIFLKCILRILMERYTLSRDDPIIKMRQGQEEFSTI